METAAIRIPESVSGLWPTVYVSRDGRGRKADRQKVEGTCHVTRSACALETTARRFRVVLDPEQPAPGCDPGNDLDEGIYSKAEESQRLVLEPKKTDTRPSSRL